MPLQNFVARRLPAISAAWLNVVDALKFTVFNDAVTKPTARTALELDPQLVAEGVDSGAANAAVVTLTGPITGYVRATGSKVSFSATAVNTEATTLNVNGTGAAAILAQDGTACTGGELFTPVIVEWTGSAWRIIAGGISLANRRTTAEIDAGVTPVDYAYPANSQYYDVRRSGVVLNSSAAASANVSALNTLGTASWGRTVTLFFPDGDLYFDDALTFTSALVGLKFAEGSQLRYTGTANKVAITFGTSTTSVVAGIDGLSLRNDTSHDWSDSGFVGLRLVRVNRQRFDLKVINGFTVNCQLYGNSTTGIAYNKLRIGTSFDAKYHLQLRVATSGAFVNENLFDGINLQQTSAYPTDEDAYGLHCLSDIGTASLNSNVFIKPSFQVGDGDGGTERVPVWFQEAGTNNSIIDARAEGGRGPVVKVDSTTFAVRYNVVSFGYLESSFYTQHLQESDGGLAFGNQVFFRQNSGAPYTSWHSGGLLEKAFGSDVGDIAVKGMFGQLSGSSTETNEVAGRIYKDYLRIGSGAAIGVYVDTSYFKQLEVKIDAKSTNLGRIAFVAYDSADNILDNGDPGHPFVVNSSLSAAATYGYSYSTPTDTRTSVQFSVGSSVQKVKILFSGGTNPLYLRAFEIIGYYCNSVALALNVYGGPQSSDYFFVDASPATVRGGGWTQRGTIAHNSLAASATVSYWQCTASGYNATAWAVSTAYELNRMVENDTGKIYVCTVAGTSAGSGGPTGTGSGIVDGTVTWDYIGTLATWTSGPSNP